MDSRLFVLLYRWRLKPAQGDPPGQRRSRLLQLMGNPGQAHTFGCGGTIVAVKDTAVVKHWASARELVGSDPPTSDDLPTTLAGEPLDSADKVREFLANLDRARPA